MDGVSGLTDPSLVEGGSQKPSFLPNSSHLKAHLDLCNVLGCVNGAALGACAAKQGLRLEK